MIDSLSVALRHEVEDLLQRSDRFVVVAEINGEMIFVVGADKAPDKFLIKAGDFLIESCDEVRSETDLTS